MRKTIITEWLKIIAGLLVFAFGVHLTIFANIGLAPWDCLGMGISYHTPLNYGLSMTAMAVVILGIDLLMKERIGYGTIIDALATGNFVQIFNTLNPFPLNQNLWTGILLMLTGFVFMALGMAVYMKCGQCCGPRDALLVGLGKRMKRVPIGIVEILLWAAVLLVGWLLGGPVGIGTLISTFGAGLVLQLVYSVIRFEPRDIRHKDVIEVTRLMFPKTEPRKVLCVLLCIALCIAVFAVRIVDGRKNTAESVQMTDFNKDLQKAAPDDKYRTTYEIFVYSFCDSNGDGIGDLNGIRSKLDYIADLGFNALWLTPVHPSSTYHKYDVDNYYAIDPAFGSMEDYEALLRECHDKGIRVYMDLVLNHTSDDHEWFRAASDYLHELPSGWEPDTSYCRYYDYYNFSRQPADGYTKLEGTEWYYEARFWSEMPDLNLRSEAVRDEIRGILAYWLGKGVDGFRLDAVTSYFEGDPDANAEFLWFVTQSGRSVDPDCYFVGEAWTDRDTIAALYGSGIDSLFDFPFANSEGLIAKTMNGTCTAADFVREMILTEEVYGRAGPDHVDAPFYTNHDMGRSAGYYPYDDGPVTKMAYAMNLLMTGNAFVYYGEELGMTGDGRDENKRAPMYWSDDADDPDMCNGPQDMDEVRMKYPSLADQKEDALSLWKWFTEVIRVRNAFPVIARGATEYADGICDDAVAAFYRRSEDYGDLLIVMNLRAQTVEKDISPAAGGSSLAAVLNTNEKNISYKDGILTLPPYSIAVFSVE